MDMQDPNRHKLQTFNEEFQNFFHAWSANWTPIGHLGQTAGPVFTPKRIKKMMSDKQVEAQKPEEEAFEKLIEYSATSLVIAYREGEYELMIDRINEQYHLGHLQGQRDYPRFISAVMKRTFAILSSVEENDNSKIGEVIQKQRGKFHSDLKFGFENPTQEKPSSFKDAVELNTKMPLTEGIQLLADYHEASPDAVRAAFLNLRNAEEGSTVLFKETVMSGYPCIYVDIFDKNGEFTRNEAIDIHTGQPMARIS